MKQTNVVAVPRLLKILFIIGALVMMLSQSVMSAVSMYQSGSAGVSVDGLWILYTFQSLIIPLVIWIGVHLSRRDRRIHLDSVFASLLLTSAALMIATTLFSSFYYLITAIPVFTTDPSLSSWLYTAFTTAVPFIIIVCGLTLVILHLRRKKQW